MHLLDAERQGRARLGIFSNADDAFLRPLLATARLKFEFVASSESARVYNAGFDEKPITVERQDGTGNVGPYRWENRVSLSATLL